MAISKENAIKAYKVFSKDWSCRGYQYEVGRTYTHHGNISICRAGFHACLNLPDCFSYYPFKASDVKVAEVSVWGSIQYQAGDTKLCASRIRIEKELDWDNVLRLCNSGYQNSGAWNSGDHNSGSRNSGNQNSGNYNSGNHNSGIRNSGDYNGGSFNVGCWNYGGHNSGGSNRGNWNGGNYNGGDHNSGHYNGGGWNCGVHNSGNTNTGDYNSGNWNSGNYNSGKGNSGNWNSGDWNSGLFNTPEQEYIFMFNKPVKKSEVKRLPAIPFLYFKLTEWIPASEMTLDEKRIHPEHNVTGGYLKTYEYKEAFRKSFEKAKKCKDWQNQLANLKALPNFDAKIFEEISGIREEELV